MLKKGDILLITSILAIVIIGFIVLKYARNDVLVHNIAIVKQDNVVIRTINLDEVREPERMKVPGYYDETILIEKGRIRFEEANCPDHVCVRTGWLSKPGDIAVCLPNHTIIKIEGQNDEIDVRIY